MNRVKMHQTLLLLVMTSLCSLLVGHKPAYSFIDQNKTWVQAQNFCREHYTDLATVNAQTDRSSVCPRDEDCEGAWVKLVDSTEQSNAMWRWIDLQKTYNASEITWGENGPDSETGNCAYVQYHNNADNELSWHSQSCKAQKRFTCCEISNKNCSTPSDKMTWCEALRYCNNKGKTLVSGFDQVKQSHAKEIVNATGPFLPRWIGLFRSATGRWMDFCDSYCAMLDDDDDRSEENCSITRPFICYDADVVLVKENMTWEEALVYCRRNYGDLAMMTDEHQQGMVKKKAKLADTEFVWVGLLYACFFDEWFWVNGHWVSSDDDNWEIRKKRHGCGLSGAMQQNGKWIKKNCNEKYNFVCSVHH